MLYLVALLLPPLALLLMLKPIQAILNAVLWLVGIGLCATVIGIVVGGPLVIAAIVHAFMAVSSHQADKRFKRLEKAMQRR